MKYILIILSFLITLSQIGCNKQKLRDRTYEDATGILNIVRHNVNTGALDGENVTAEVDLLISIDSSGSMSDDREALADNLETFIDNLDPSINLKIGVTKGYDNFLLGCFDIYTDPAEKENAKTAIRDNSTTRVYERPIHFAREAFEANTSEEGCLRPFANKFAFILTDEDERKASNSQGNTADSSIDAATRTEFINWFNSNSIKLYSVTYGITDPIEDNIISGIDHNAYATTEVTTGTGGSNYDLQGDFASNLQVFSNDVSSSIVNVTLSSSPFVPESLRVYNNGSLLQRGVDYSINGNNRSISLTSSIQFATANLSANFALLSDFSLIIDNTYMDVTYYKATVEGELCLEGTEAPPSGEINVASCVKDWTKDSWNISFITKGGFSKD